MLNAPAITPELKSRVRLG